MANIAEADYDMTDMAFLTQRGPNMSGPQPGDESLAVRFFFQPQQNTAKSKLEGRPIFEEMEFVEIAVPANKDSVVIRPATARDIDRFPRHYEAFKNRTDQAAVEGTPLSAWPQVTRAQVEELAFFKVRSVEQLANINDADAGKFMGINALRDSARVFLEQSKQDQPIAELNAKNSDLEAQIAQMQKDHDALTAKIDNMSKSKK